MVGPMYGVRRARIVLSWALVAGGGGCGDDEGAGMAWNPETSTVGGGSVGDTDDDDDAGTADSADETSGEACTPGEVEPCLCPDGLSLGEQACDDDGQGLGACDCPSDTDGSGNPMPPLPEELCFLGPDRQGNACIPLGAFYASLPLGYDYPPSVSADGHDRPPIGMLDIDAVDASMAMAPNFALDELAQTSVGRWAVIQPHAVERLQAMRDEAGSIAVVTGYLSPSENADRGGELYARHQYGDGFDLQPNATGLSQLADLCADQGGEAVQFESHLHCQFSAVPLDEDLFGPPPGAEAPAIDQLASLDAWIERDGVEFWAPALGFVEGQPRRQWTARDEQGAVIGGGEGQRFDAPPGAVTVDVLVGGRVARSIAVD